jgi:voltage-gated potassium channel
MIVTLVGAAGMYAFEGNTPDGRGLDTYSDALWWTAMIMTTLGSDYWPLSGSGRVLCFFLSLYAFGVFGYVTATLATFFIGSDAASEEADLASARSIAALRTEIASLGEEIRALKR